MKSKLILALALVSTVAQASYEDHFPAYFEYCGTTQWKTTDGQIGGATGHAFTYIHGLCKNYSEKFPQVVPCDDLTAEERAVNHHDGVGISLDKNFSNVNWIAVPGRDLMFFGNIEKRAPSKRDALNVAETASSLRIFEGVKLLDGKIEGTYGTAEYETNVALNTLGTDIAVNWARSLYCIRIPVKKDALANVASYLNQSNQRYQSVEPYKWDMIKNNCVHLSINQGHALGINSSIKTDQFILRQLLNLAVPANGYMMYSDLAVLKKPSYRKLKNDFKKKNFSPVQVGSLLMNYEAYPNGDTFITEGLGLQSLPRVTKPLNLLMTPEKYKRFLTSERSDLKVSAESWMKIYQGHLEKSQRANEVEFSEYLKAQLELAEKIVGEEKQ